MSQPSAARGELQSEPPHAGRLATPESWLAILIGLQLVLWTIIPWHVSWSLPLDVVSDGLSWGHEWQWGYYKHPPLPSWTVELFFEAFGNAGPYLLSQLAIAATYVFVFLLGRSFLPALWAATGALLLAGVYYFSIPTPEFNHNVAQMPLWAAASYFYYKAWKSGDLRWWIALGIAAGLGILAKYSAALLLVAMLGHCLSTRSARAAFSAAGPYVAIFVCIVLVSPHLVWAMHAGFPTLHYAVGRAGNAASVVGRIVAPFKFLLAQAVDIAPAFVVAAIVGLIPREPVQIARNEDLNFLLWLTLAPPFLTFLLSLATGLGVRDMWGTPMWNLTGLIIVEAAGARRDSASLPRLAYCLAGLFAIGLCGYLLANVVVPDWENKPSRIQWPARQLSDGFAAIWENHQHRPLQIVAADGWLGGLVATDVRPQGSVWIDASSVKSPWITPARLSREGALVLWRVRTTDGPPATLAKIPGLRILGVKSFGWPSAPKAQPLRIGYAIVAPSAPDSSNSSTR